MRQEAAEEFILEEAATPQETPIDETGGSGRIDLRRSSNARGNTN
jgi:hypothetical protein